MENQSQISPPYRFTFVSLGYFCEVKNELRIHRYTIPERLPFDWMVCSIQFVIDSFATDFKIWEKEKDFYVPSIHKTNKCLHIKHRGYYTKFIHDLDHSWLKDGVVFTECYDADGFDGDLPLREGMMRQFVEGYGRRIVRLRGIIQGSIENTIESTIQNTMENTMESTIQNTIESTMQNPNPSHLPVFVRYMNHNLTQGFCETEENALQLYRTLQKYCGEKEFVLLVIWPDFESSNKTHEIVKEKEYPRYYRGVHHVSSYKTQSLIKYFHDMLVEEECLCEGCW